MRIVVRNARPDDAEALVRIHADASAYYAALDPALFQAPPLDGFAEHLAKDLAKDDPQALDLVAELDGEVILDAARRRRVALDRPAQGTLKTFQAW